MGKPSLSAEAKAGRDQDIALIAARRRIRHVLGTTLAPGVHNIQGRRIDQDLLDGGATVSTVITATNDPDEIRQQMAKIRQSLRQNVKGVYAGAEAASDWKHYVKLYPWAAVGAAFAIGFVVVPRKRRSVSQTAEQAATLAVAKVTDSVEKVEKPESKKGWIGTLVGLAAPFAVRAVQGYALSYMENFLAQQAQGQQGASDSTRR